MINIDNIIAYEEGTMSHDEMVEFFQSLIDDGSAWTLQGHYGRTAERLIRAGLCHLPSQCDKSRNVVKD